MTEKKSCEEWMREWIATDKGRIDSRLKDWDKVVPDRIPNIYFSTGLYAKSIALYSLLLGDREESLRWFKKSVEYYEKSILEQRIRIGVLESEAGVCLALINMAVLSYNEEVMGNAARTCLEIDENYMVKYREYQDAANFYYYVKTISHIILGEAGRALKIVDKIDFQASPELKDYFTGLRICLEGIIKNDKKMTLEGLDLSLKYHYQKYGERYPGPYPGPADEMLCVPATVHIRLAKMKGITIKHDEIDDKYRSYIPWNLFD